MVKCYSEMLVEGVQAGDLVMLPCMVPGCNLVDGQFRQLQPGFTFKVLSVADGRATIQGVTGSIFDHQTEEDRIHSVDLGDLVPSRSDLARRIGATIGARFLGGGIAALAEFIDWGHGEIWESRQDGARSVFGADHPWATR
jgi:hypothetical protein